MHYERIHKKTEEEFMEDFSRFRYVKRLINRYVETDELKERLILNHLILIFNVFDRKAATLLLYKTCEPKSIVALTTFLTFLNIVPSDVINTNQIAIDRNIMARLIGN